MKRRDEVIASIGDAVAVNAGTKRQRIFVFASVGVVPSSTELTAALRRAGMVPDGCLTGPNEALCGSLIL
jgi:hypothetical protein